MKTGNCRNRQDHISEFPAVCQQLKHRPAHLPSPRSKPISTLSKPDSLTSAGVQRKPSCSSGLTAAWTTSAVRRVTAAGCCWTATAGGCCPGKGTNLGGFRVAPRRCPGRWSPSPTAGRGWAVRTGVPQRFPVLDTVRSQAGTPHPTGRAGCGLAARPARCYSGTKERLVSGESSPGFSGWLPGWFAASCQAARRLQPQPP